MFFLTLVFTELLRGYTVRNYLRPIWSGIVENKMMAIATLVSLGLALIFVLVPSANDVFDLTDTLPYWGWLICLATAIFITIIDELVKYSIRRRLRTRARWSMIEDKLNQVLVELRAANSKINRLEDQSEMNKGSDGEGKSGRGRSGGVGAGAEGGSSSSGGGSSSSQPHPQLQV